MKGIGLRISACYIVKDERENILRSIASILGAVDEIIVVDTGSTDGTIEVMTEYETKGICRLYHFSWCDDFAAARNYALAQVTGDWVVCLDADEYFSEETRTRLRQLIEACDAYDGLLFHRVNIEADGSVLGTDTMLRAFKKTEDTHYRRRIHEEVYRGDCPLGHGRLYTIGKDEMCIFHTGYERMVSRAKAERNLKILLEDMEKDEDKTHYYHYLADAYYGLEDEREAVRYARLDVDLGPQPRTNPASSYRILLHYAGSAVEKQALLERAVRDYPKEASFHADLAETSAYLLHFADAIASMERALALYQKAGGMPTELYAVATQHIAQWKRILAHAATIRISACCIVKNEEKDLPRWLENTAVYADERIVVDTGSTDATLAIAEQERAGNGAKPPLHVRKITWQEDFAAAKNVAIERATGDWIAFLDADEYFETPMLVRAYIAMMCLRDIVPEVVQLPIINVDEDRDYAEIHRFAGVRIFQRQDAIRYVGRIHENLRKADGELTVYRELDRLPIYHLGYSSKRMEKKNQRNFALLQKDIEENGEQPEHYGYLAECYFGFGDYEKALYYALQAIHGECVFIGSASDHYRRAIASMHRLGRPIEEIQSVVEEAIQAFPNLPDFYGELGILLQQRGALQEALSVLRHALTLGARASGEEASMFGIQYPMLCAAVEILKRALSSTSVQEGGGVCVPEEEKEQNVKISACCIVKNEEKDLPRWLENTAVYADERIVVDTGSTDATLAILEQEAQRSDRTSPIRIHRIAWQDDFAAAKNAAIERATGDWIAFLDADEYFEAPMLVRDYIEEMQRRAVRPDAIQSPMLHLDEDAEGRELYRTSVVRVFQRADDIRYVGRIHENLAKRDGKIELHIEPARLRILHVGYASKRMAQKVERNFRILQQEIAAEGERPEHWRYLAESYYGMGDYERSLQYVQKALSEGCVYVGAQSDLYRRGIACMYQLGYVLGEIQTFVEDAIAAFPELPDFYADLGMILKDRGKQDEALAALRQSLAVAETGQCVETSEFSKKKERVLSEIKILERETEMKERKSMDVPAEPSIMLLRIAKLQSQLFVVLAERMVQGTPLTEMVTEGRLLSAEMKDALKALEGEGNLSLEAYQTLAPYILQYGSDALRERYRVLGEEVCV